MHVFLCSSVQARLVRQKHTQTAATALLTKQLLHRAHREEEPPLNPWKFKKPIFLVKRQSSGVFRVNDDASRSQFAAVLQSSIQRVHQEHGPESLSSKRRADGQTPEKCGRDNRIFWQFLRNLSGNCVQLYGVLGQGVIAGYRLSVRCDYEGNRRTFLEVLRCLFVKVHIESLDAARKSRPIMFRTERLNNETRLFRFVGQLTPHLLPVPLSSFAGGFVGCRRMQDRIYEHVARLVMKSEKLEVLDGICRCLLGACNNEFCYRRAAQGRRARDQLLLLGSYPGLQALLF